MDLVSIIIPIYNVADYLDRCIASAAAQTYQNIEIILIDDGSTDRSPEICDHWAKKDPRITVVHQINGGVSAARNAGLQAATGAFLLQLDSDDYIAPNAVDLLVTAAVETNSDMVICDFIKGTDGEYNFSNQTSGLCEQINGETALSRIYLGDHNALRYAVPWCRLCRRQLYEGIQYPDGKIFEDIYTTHKLLHRSRRITVLDVPLFYYFQRPNSIMNTSFSMKKLDYLQALVERVEFYASYNLHELKSIAYDELLHALIWEYSRTRDILHSEEGMKYITQLFRTVYRKGYSSRRYPQETARFLAAFNHDPEWIIRYWRVGGKLKQIFKRNG